jgi:hypothetical protein
MAERINNLEKLAGSLKKPLLVTGALTLGLIAQEISRRTVMSDAPTILNLFYNTSEAVYALCSIIYTSKTVIKPVYSYLRNPSELFHF